jgi:hypothetical protein
MTSRKTVYLTIEDKGRDEGKMYLLTEMPARQGEEWAIRAVGAAMKYTTEMPEGFENGGMASLAQIGLRALAGVPWEVLKPLLDEMMSCAQIVPDPRNQKIYRQLIDSDTEEISTRLKLRSEIFKLHADFLNAVAV